MEITEVRIKLMEDVQERLQAFCSITFDHCFVIRDLKIIEGVKGSFVAMPSRKLTDHCPQCNCKNHLRAVHCNQCGARLKEDRAAKDDDGRAKLYADIAHPINSRCREMIQNQVLQAFREEQIRAKQPGYVCTYDDYGEDRYATLEVDHAERSAPTPAAATYIGGGDATHRIDGGNGRINAPHLNAVHRDAAHDPSRIAPHFTTENTENFGAGIL